MPLSKLAGTQAPPAVILIRLMVGAVFLSEGIQKFLYADTQGAGRFAKIGIPAPELMGPVVGATEIVCGSLVLAGLLTRFAAFALFVIITVAILSTKIPILLGHGYWLFSLPKASHYGFWSMAHEARTDFSMWLGSLFLVLVGSDARSIDAMIRRRRRGTTEQGRISVEGRE